MILRYSVACPRRILSAPFTPVSRDAEGAFVLLGHQLRPTGQRGSEEVAGAARGNEKMISMTGRVARRALVGGENK